MTHRTYNIELTMSDETRSHWMALLRHTRDAYNRCSDIAVAENLPLDVKTFHNRLYGVIRSEYPTIPAQGAIKVYKEVLSALRSIRSNGCEDAETPQRKSLCLHLDKRMYARLTVDGIAIASHVPGQRETCGFVMYDAARELFGKYPTADPLIFARGERLFLSVPFEVSPVPCGNGDSVGVDMGIKRLFVTSEGKAFVDKAYLKERRRIRYLKRCLKARKTKSSKRHLNRVSRKERNLSRDMVRRSVKSLLSSTDAGVIVVEVLSKIKKNTSKTKDGHKRKRHNSRLSQVPFYGFRVWLTHKATLAGRRVESVSPTYTSQTDSRTGKRDGQRMGCRYVCSDGVVLDADWNAAVNIARRANHPVSKHLPVDGGLTFLTGRAQSTAQSSATTRLRGKPATSVVGS